MENNLLKTNFTGTAGFRWWIGQIAPEKVQGDQLNGTGNAWGCRSVSYTHLTLPTKA